MSYLKEYAKGVLAGIFIGIGGAVYLSCDIKYIGALLFSVALLTICLCAYSLYTGKVGMLTFNHKPEDFGLLGMCLLGNLTGTLLMGLGVRVAIPALEAKAALACASKLAQELPEALFRAIFCGMLMYIAVSVFRKKNTVVGILFCVPVFILSGFEHSVANMFYFGLEKGVSFESIIYIALIVLGNSIGALVISLLELAATPPKSETEKTETKE